MDARDIARVHVDTWRTTYPGMVPAEHLSSLSYEAREQMWNRVLREENRARGGFCYVAENKQGQAIGFASGGPERTGDPVYKGEVSAIYILEPYQGNGIGRRLLLACVDRLLQMGITTMLIWVIGANPACRFYEARGGTKVQERQDVIDSMTIDEVAYGWTDLTAFEVSKGEHNERQFKSESTSTD